MNKKFFSAVLMGALLLGGTFVSCQDYDDDIENLQNQIDKLASADALSSKVSELQSAISAAQSAAEAKAAAANTVAEAAKKAAGDADAKAAAAQKAADDVKAAAEKAGDDASKEAKAAAAAAQKVADDLKAALETAVTEADVNAAIDTALKAALEKYATVEALQEVADELAKIQDAIAKCATDEDLQKLADKVAALEGSVPAEAVAVLSAVAPYELVKVRLEEAHWATFTTKAHKERFAKLVAAFPEDKIEDIAKGELRRQGGHLPVIITPASVKLNDEYSFSLQGADSKVSGAKVSSPVVGMPWAKIETPKTQIAVPTFDATGNVKAETDWEKYTVYGQSYMLTKATDANDCFWTLTVDPEVWNGSYQNIDDAQTLVVENPDGTTVKTAFAYTLETVSVGNVNISVTSQTAAYSKEINLLAHTSNNGVNYLPVFSMENEWLNHYILSVEEPADVEDYDIEVKGSCLVVNNFPKTQPSITIHNVKLIALGLNGSTDEKVTDVKIVKALDATNNLPDREVVLTTKKTGTDYVNVVTWNVAKDLKLGASALKKFVDAATKTVEFTLDDNTTISGTLFVNDAKDKSATDYKDAVTIGFTFKSDEVLPGEYTMTVKAGDVYVSYPKLVISNPDDAIAIYPDLIKDDVLQIVGVPNMTTTADKRNKVTYLMHQAFKTAGAVTIDKFVDLDYAEDPSLEMNWINPTYDNKLDSLIIFKNDSLDANGDKMNQLYTPRNFKVVYTFFDNPANKDSIEFVGQVVSEIWSGDPIADKIIAPDLTKASAVFEKTNANKIDLKTVVASAKYAAGPKKGQSYNFFGDGTTTGSAAAVNVYNYWNPNKISAKLGDKVFDGTTLKSYVLDANDKVIEVTNQTWKNALAGEYTLLGYYLTTADWTKIKAIKDANYDSIQVAGVANQYHRKHRAFYVNAVDTLWEDAEKTVIDTIRIDTVRVSLTNKPFYTNVKADAASYDKTNKEVKKYKFDGAVSEALNNTTFWTTGQIEGTSNTYAALLASDDALIADPYTVGKRASNGQPTTRGWYTEELTEYNSISGVTNQTELALYCTMFDTYKSVIAFEQDKDKSVDANPGTPVAFKIAGGKVTNVSFAPKDAQVFGKYCNDIAADNTITLKTGIKESITGEKVVEPVIVVMTIKDAWGMTMTVDIPLTLKTN